LLYQFNHTKKKLITKSNKYSKSLLFCIKIICN